MELVRTLGLLGSNGCQQFEGDGKFGSGFIRRASRWCIWLVFIFIFITALVTTTITTVAIVTITIVFVTEIVVEWDKGRTMKANNFEMEASEQESDRLCGLSLWQMVFEHL